MWHANLKALPLRHSVCIYQSISTSNVLYRAMLSHISKAAVDMARLQPDKSTNTCLLCGQAAWRALFLGFGLLKWNMRFNLHFSPAFSNSLHFFFLILVFFFINFSRKDFVNTEDFSCVLLSFHFFSISYESFWEFEWMLVCMWVCSSVADFGSMLCFTLQVYHHNGEIHNSWGANTQFSLFSEGNLKVRWNDSHQWCIQNCYQNKCSLLNWWKI